MQIGMIGLGRMGANMVRRLLKGGHECVAYDPRAAAVQELAQQGARAAHSVAELVAQLAAPRAVWIMVPAALVDGVIGELTPLLGAEDVLIDGGNSNYHDDIRRAASLEPRGIHYVDVGTSGGVLGFEQGYCLMIGGAPAAVARIEPALATLAPGGRMPQARAGAAASAAAATQGYLHCGAAGAGHFVKMVHNGIEYGLMAAYAEGLNLLAHADAGLRTSGTADAETAPLAEPRYFQYQLNVAAIAEVWRHGSIIASRLLDLTAAALARDPHLAGFAGRVADSGEGRWTVEAAIEVGVPAPVLSAALYARFDSRGAGQFANQLLSAMRLGFGGHLEQAAEGHHGTP
ncbi:MAG: decarboxylating 6-phosphogluconate dehydrogenase [Gammaproteobacteria bacterium]|nr:decarboxylating 6-phosphogluconate dehydrogenase [Gammaproteobacteria bacterium]MBV9620164.1 decarboxylating 6-phosphogluconate dehydrogenase [Gammaproteobacteria bacterium]